MATCSLGAARLKELDSTHGEIKSMRTAAGYRVGIGLGNAESHRRRSRETRIPAPEPRRLARANSSPQQRACTASSASSFRSRRRLQGGSEQLLHDEGGLKALVPAVSATPRAESGVQPDSVGKVVLVERARCQRDHRRHDLGFGLPMEFERAVEPEGKKTNFFLFFFSFFFFFFPPPPCYLYHIC